MDTVDLRRVGTVSSGGMSLSGLDDPIASDGGGFWRFDGTEGDTFGADDGLDWRADLEEMDGGAQPVIVLLCSERLFGPVLDSVVDRPGQDFSIGAAFTAAASAALRATSMSISGSSEKPLRRGMLFSIEHSNWGWRVYRITRISGNAITIRPPLREAVSPGAALDFAKPRCQMRLATPISNPTSIGRYTRCEIGFVEDMVPPADA